MTRDREETELDDERGSTATHVLTEPLVVIIAAGWVIVSGARFVLPVLLPWITVDFGIDGTTAGVLLTGLWTAYALTQYPAGLLADRTSDRTVLLLGVGTALVGTGFTSVAPTFETFVLGGLLFGVGAGLYAPPRVTILSDTYGERRGSALGITFAAGNVGSAVLPAAASTVAATFGWRMGLSVALPVFAAIFVGTWIVVPTSASSEHIAETKSIEGNEEPPAENPIHARFIVGASRLYRQLGSPAVIRATAAFTLMTFVYQGLTSFFPTYLSGQMGLTPQTTSLVFGVFFVSAAASQWTAGAAADRFGDRRLLAAVSAFGVLTVLAIPFVDGPVSLTVLSALLGTRLGIGPVGNGYIAVALRGDGQGAAYGLVRTVFFTVGATGAVVTGAFIDHGLFHEVFYVYAAMTAVAALLFAVLPSIHDRGETRVEDGRRK
ncbi:MFS transporter [Halegenticoccus tardaugens]|uniref:MFS transporter n=1 Tax=Halegenticoccus tardaugens TaxID=2071624 RepID=UPI00100B4D42|nr:MFS transporter [Halegenticoccus tardaugens]